MISDKELIEKVIRTTRQDTLKEVVEWIKEVTIMGVGDNGLYLQMYLAEEEWQSKLKDWNVSV